MSSSNRTAVITGIGVRTSIGNSKSEFWDGLCSGKSGVTTLTRFDSDRFSCKVAGEVDLSKLPEWPQPHRFAIKRTSLFVQLAVAASIDCLSDAQTTAEKFRQKPGAICLGVAMGGLPAIETGVLRQESKGPTKSSPYLIPKLIPSAAAGMLALFHQLGVPQYTFCGGCASGLQALSYAKELIESGSANWVLAGGSEAVITPITFSGFQAMRSLSPAKSPGVAPRPFDRDRDGLIIGEGAAILLVEERKHATERGVRPIAALSGSSLHSGTSLAFFLTESDLEISMRQAIKNAGVPTEKIGCIFGNASGLPDDDKELAAIRNIFSDHDLRPQLTATKGNLGQLFGAATPTDVAAAALCIQNNALPPIRNFTTAPEGFEDMRFVTDCQKLDGLEHCLINSFGLGGLHASLILSKP